MTIIAGAPVATVPLNAPPGNARLGDACPPLAGGIFRPLHVGPGADWSAIARADVPLIIEQRTLSPELVAAARAVGCGLRVPLVGLAALAELLDPLPALLASDILALCQRFAQANAIDRVSLRFEVVGHDACRKFHADMTDVRLVSTYDGPGTDYRTDTGHEAPVERLAAGDIALFKGHGFGEGHAVILHRSPPIMGTGVERRLLVIDTPRLGAGNQP